MLISVIIPVYNEERTVEKLVQTVFAVPIKKEVIIVNDNSTDGTKSILDGIEKKLKEKPSLYVKGLEIIHKETNEGKGAAIRTALSHISGDIVIIQDADLETDPYEYPKLLEPFEKYGADIAFGSRFQMTGTRRVFRTHRYLTNRFLTMLSNIFSGIYITDMETCYKLFRRDIIQSFKLKSKRFGIEPELTAKAAKGPWKIYEVPITYNPRDRSAGKKINWWDGVKAVLAIIRFNLSR